MGSTNFTIAGQRCEDAEICTAQPRVQDSWQIGLPFDTRRVEELEICVGCGWEVAFNSFIYSFFHSFIQVFIEHLLNARYCAQHRGSIIPALGEFTVSWGSTVKTSQQGRNTKSQRWGLHWSLSREGKNPR